MTINTDAAEKEADDDFLREVERRAGASREEMLKQMELDESGFSSVRGRPIRWLRRILGEAK